MLKTRIPEGQIVVILKEHVAGMKTAEICRRNGISQPTKYSCNSNCGGLKVSEVKRLKALDEANCKLK